MKCTRCKKEINPGVGYYNRPSGVMCATCGDIPAPNVVEMQKFVLKIAKMECGCAPSAGFMEKLIIEAREILKGK